MYIPGKFPRQEPGKQARISKGFRVLIFGIMAIFVLYPMVGWSSTHLEMGHEAVRQSHHIWQME